ncbi:Snf7-domain-containing protein [Globomyces pollinis-pini]|nr:Snf7-domain-containing protein [Globomyces pollinis-pini]
MGNLVSKSPKVSSKDKAILELKVQRDKLKQYEKKASRNPEISHIQIVIEKELAVAKQQLQLKNHHAARLALTKKKYQESLLEKTGNQLLTIEQLTGTIEYALVEQDIINRLDMGNKVLEKIHQEMSIEKVEKIMDDTADGIAYQNEIQEIMSRELSEEDEEEIMAQLDALVQEEMENDIKILPTVPKGDAVENHAIDSKFPNVPVKEPEISIKTKEKGKAKSNPEDGMVAV